MSDRTLLDLDGVKKLLKPAVSYAQVSAATCARFRGVLPDLIVNTWEQHGLLKFRDGFMWLTDPDAMRASLPALQGDVFLRTAFGDLMWIFEGHVWTFSVVTGRRFKEVPVAQCATWLDVTTHSTPMLNDGFFLSIFKKARKRLPALSADEVYAFTPLLETIDPERLEVRPLVELFADQRLNKLGGP